MPTEEDIKKKTYNLVNVILGCDVLRHSNEELQRTTAFRQKIKFHSNGLAEAIEEALNGNLMTMFKIDQEIYQNVSHNLFEYQETMSKSIVDMRPDQWLELNQIIQLYLNNKEAFQKTFEITLKEIK